MTERRKAWQTIAHEAQEYRDASISRIKPDVPQIPSNLPRNVMDIPRKLLSPDEIQITELPVEELADMLRLRKVTAIVVTLAFLRRAGVAQKLANCVTELLPESALERARYLDEYYATHGKPLGPLHGVPISVKEHIGMKGLRLNAGYIAWWDEIAKEDAHVLQVLQRAGAVFHARTTQPQSLMHLETDSNLYGVTVNPYNRDVSAGGSSGGEGALVALRGSCLGIGTDVGGSIRSPAANNGLYGFKPTAFRVPTDGWSSIMAGADTISSVVGPLCASLGGIALFMKVIIDAKPWLSEPALIPMPWNSNAQISPNHPLKIGVLTHDGVVTPHPPITNTLNAVVAKLKKLLGVSIIPWKPHLHDEAWAIISSLYFADAGEADASVMAESGEPWRPLTKWIIKENPCVKNLSTGELAYWQEEREIYRKEYSNAWNATATGQNKDTGALEGLMDVILCPAGPGVAPSHNTAKYWGYTSQWNLLDYPAVVFPVAKSDKNVDRPDTYKPMSGADLDHWALCKNFGSPNGDALADLKLQYKTDSPEKFEKLPIALQLVGRRFEDEKVLGILDYITRSIGLPFGKFP